jgi:hypothetical protein
MANDPLFSNGTDQAPEDKIEELKQKFTKEDGSLDIEALLKKAAHQELHIAKIEPENQNLRKELDTRLTYQDLLEKLQPQTSSTLHQDNDGLERVENPKANVTEDVIERMFEDRFNKKQQEAIQVANVNYVKQELEKAWGSNYPERLREVAKGFYMSEDEVKRRAMDNPKSLLAIVLPMNKPSNDNSFVPPANRQNTSANTLSTEKNWKYYREIMLKDRKRFESLTAEMHTQAEKLGEAFYN